MALVFIGNIRGGKGDKGDVGNIYLGQLPQSQNLLNYFGPSFAGSWGVPTQTVVDSTAGRPTDAKPATFTVIPAGSTASTQVWAEYGIQGRVWHSSVNNGVRLSPWKEITAGAHFGPLVSSSYTTLNDIDVSGTFTLWSGTDAKNAGAPAAFPGTVRSFVFGNAGWQEFRTTDPIAPGPRTWIRGKGSQGWGTFREVGAVDPLTVSPNSRSGFKNVALALNQPASNGTEAISNDTVRIPQRYGVGSKRVRFHVQNWSFVYGTTYGAVSFTGAWMGKASGMNFTGTPSKVLDAFTTPANGDRYSSPWFYYDFAEDIDHLFSVGFTTAAGQVNMQSRGGCYRSGNSADAGLSSGFTGTVSTTSPFDMWLEVEVPADTPVLGGLGDSNLVGTGTTLPVHDSWLSQHCRTAKALPYFMAIHGSSTATWSDPTKTMWGRYPEQAKPDAVVYFLGQNDEVEGVTLATLQGNLSTMLPIVREKLATDVYLVTITPANAKSAAVNTVRKAYNNWMKTRPLGVKDCFDFSAAVSDDDATIRAVDDFDGLHFKTGAHTKLAAKLSERPVTPVVLTQAEVAALRALV